LWHHRLKLGEFFVAPTKKTLDRDKRHNAAFDIAASVAALIIN